MDNAVATPVPIGPSWSTIVAVPVLNSQGTISHTIAAVGLGSQLDRASSLALAQDMRAAAQEVAAQNGVQIFLVSCSLLAVLAGITMLARAEERLMGEAVEQRADVR